MKNTPALVHLSSEAEYKKYYVYKYCKSALMTFDGISVKFYEDQFEHAFYESSNKKKSSCSGAFLLHLQLHLVASARDRRSFKCAAQTALEYGICDFASFISLRAERRSL